MYSGIIVLKTTDLALDALKIKWQSMKIKHVNKKFKTLLTFIFLINNVVSAQNNDSTSVNSKRCAITVSFAPEYSNSKLRGNQTIIDIRDSTETGKLAYSAAIGINYKLCEKLMIETGIVFNNKGEQSKKIDLGNSFAQLNFPVYASYINSFYFIGIPLKANYILLNRKAKIFLTGGLNSSILIKAVKNVQLEYTSKQTENSKSNIDLSVFNKFQLSLFGGVGIQTMLDKNTSITITPLFTHTINSLTPSALKTHYYSLGLNVGLQFYIP
jgi:hypothetical protein